MLVGLIIMELLGQVGLGWGKADSLLSLVYLVCLDCCARGEGNAVDGRYYHVGCGC